ncbi:signal peptide-containing protein [Theileria equi strain WA]|uniref:Signal peptide-containing protein n=1 Tax=Theileria equi strain WA TaxID=1537102 RepID=L0AZE7_THEEQ|nr:signal peptide-containing protein [Theileria equi strain WA]AFZ80957.1 signal peptide-containing protein [Theileria equi strain WA]|eukprot:XP_004830623.1 signal peptide-containing protein [Theileria equi strain WA]
MRTSYALRLFSFLWLCGTGISADKKNVKEEVRILDLLNHDKLKIDVEQDRVVEGDVIIWSSGRDRKCYFARTHFRDNVPTLLELVVKAGEVYGLVRFCKGSDGSWKSNCPSLKGPENDAQEVTPANEVSTNKAPEQGQSSSIRDIITDPHYLGKGEPERAANILELGKVNMLTAPKVPAGMQVLGLGL